MKRSIIYAFSPPFYSTKGNYTNSRGQRRGFARMINQLILLKIYFTNYIPKDVRFCFCSYRDALPVAGLLRIYSPVDKRFQCGYNFCAELHLL